MNEVHQQGKKQSRIKPMNADVNMPPKAADLDKAAEWIFGKMAFGE